MLDQANDLSNLERKHQLEIEAYKSMHRSQLTRVEHMLLQERSRAKDDIKRLNEMHLSSITFLTQRNQSLDLSLKSMKLPLSEPPQGKCACMELINQKDREITQLKKIIWEGEKQNK